MKLDINTLTIGEVAKIESLSGQSITSLMNMGEGESPLGLLLGAVTFVIQKRANPELTWQEVLDSPMVEAMEVFSDESDDPKED